VTHKEAATTFLKMASAGDVRAAYDQFIASNFIHHNPYFRGDRASLLAAMEDAARTHPNRSLDIQRVWEDGDTVITHSRVTRQDPGAPPIAVVHIFRFANDRVVELWDLGQPVDPKSPNDNGMF